MGTEHHLPEVRIADRNVSGHCSLVTGSKHRGMRRQYGGHKSEKLYPLIQHQGPPRKWGLQDLVELKWQLMENSCQQPPPLSLPVLTCYLCSMENDIWRKMTQDKEYNYFYYHQTWHMDPSFIDCYNEENPTFSVLQCTTMLHMNTAIR